VHEINPKPENIFSKQQVRMGTRTGEILTAILLFLSIGLVEFWPVFTGKVPLPTDVFLQFSVFQTNPVAHGSAPDSHSEMSDVVTQMYPWRAYARSSFRHGEIPLWNPFILSGTPFQANGQSALFYPPNWIFHVLPMPAAWVASLLLKITLLGAFTFLFVRALGCSNIAAMGSGVVLVMSGFFWSWLPWPTTDAMLWLPLTCYAILRLFRTGRGIFLVGFSYAMPVLSGQAEIAFYVTGAATLFALILCTTGSVPVEGNHIKLGRFLILLVSAWFVSVGFAAIQLFPTMEWLQLTHRSISDLWAPLHLKKALAFFSRDLSHNLNVSGFRIPVEAAYAGGLTLIAAPLAWFFPNRRLAIGFMVLLLISFAGVYGIEPVRSIELSVPVFQGAKKEQMLLIVEFSLAVLSGMGLTVLQQDLLGRKRKALLLSTVVSILVLGAAAFLNHGGASASWWRMPNSIFIFISTALLLIWLRAKWRLSSRHFALGALILLMLDLGSYCYGYIPFVRADAIYPSAPVFDFLRAQPQPFRILPLDDSLPVNIASYYELSDPGGYDMILQRVTRLTWDLTSMQKASISFQAERLAGTSNRLIDMLNVKYLLAIENSKGAQWCLSHPDRFKSVFRDGNVLVFENLNLFEFATVAPQKGAQVLRDDAAQLARVTSSAFDPYRQVILSKGISAPGNHPSPLNGPKSRMMSYRRSANSFSFGIDTPHKGVLVVSEMHFPGWHVYVDGVEQPLLRANYAFMGVAVNRGIHAVRFDFRPAVFLWGREISLITIGVMVVIVFFQKKTLRAAFRRKASIAAIAAAACLIAGFTVRFVSTQSKEMANEKLFAAGKTPESKTRSGYFTIYCESAKPPDALVCMDFDQGEPAHVETAVLPMMTRASADMNALPWKEIGISIANPGTQDNSIALKIGFKGGDRQESLTLKLAPGHQMSKMLADLFPNSQGKTPGTLSLESRMPFSLFIARLAGAKFQAIPFQLQEPQPGPLAFPQIAVGGGWNTEIYLTNVASTIASGRLEFYTSEQMPFVFEYEGAKRHIIPYAIPPGESLRISPGP
jgi:hypothetical protein